ncbi:MAG: fatty acid desaturase family protein [Bacteriovoracaceae bacterium]|jgi:fatty acid desaturase|nr:fatty acid desaturase family protein [Bacteriovoracaceae bacterium]
MNLNTLFPREKIQAFEKINSLRALARLLFELSLIFFLFYLGVKSTWYVYPLIVLMIASRQHALLVLMHDASHGVLVKTKFLNDFLGEFIAWNHFMLMRGYRRHHRKHHVLRNLNTMKDPDFARKQNHKWIFPMKRSKLIKILLSDLLMFNTYELIQEAKDAKNNELSSRTDKIIFLSRIVYYITLFIILVSNNYLKNYILFWVIPMLSFLKVILRVRSIADHFNTGNTSHLDRTRSIEAPLLERILIAPCNIGIHNEHHIYANVPYYNLLRLRRYMMKNLTYKNSHICSRSYYQTLFRELTYEG